MLVRAQVRALEPAQVMEPAQAQEPVQVQVQVQGPALVQIQEPAPVRLRRPESRHRRRKRPTWWHRRVHSTLSTTWAFSAPSIRTRRGRRAPLALHVACSPRRGLAEDFSHET